MTHASLARRWTFSSALLILASCSNAGSLGSVLGTVLGGGQQQQQSNQVSGTVQQVDTRSQQIALQQSNGQTVAISYDSKTQVVYENKSYPVSSLDPGDRVTARIQSSNNGGYYADVVQVDQPVQGSTSSSASSDVRTLQGTVRQVDSQNGLFTMDVSGGSRLTVSMPYSPSRTDLARFQSLRAGDNVRFAGVYLNNTRVELRQFY